MKKKYNHVVLYFKHLTFVIMFFAMVLQPFAQAILFYTNCDYELVSLNSELDIDEEEKQESENDKIEIQFVSPHSNINFKKHHSVLNNYYLFKQSKFSSEVTIPPPEYI